MMKDNDKNNVGLNQVEPKLMQLLCEAPKYGSCTLEIIYHHGQITRIITRKEEAQLVTSSKD